MKHPPTHRCKGSLAAGVSIRYTVPFSIAYETIAWQMFHLTSDSETMQFYMHYATTITYCPFCGAELGVKHGEGE